MCKKFALSFVLATWVTATVSLSNLIAQNLNCKFRAKISYPGQTLANVWGYEANGREYALVGGSKGLIVVDITNPDLPKHIVQIPGPNNLWKEIKTYHHYAYVVSEGGQGVQILDLSVLPKASLRRKYYKGDGPILNQLNTIHALQVDETKGFLYVYGSNLFGGGAIVFDLKQDPWTPKYVGKFDQLGYIHDGYADNDTMYSAHIYAGYFAVVNMTDKANPELINFQTTPSAFTHNTWLGDDRRTILATDEKDASWLSVWDLSDPTDIKLHDRIRSGLGNNSMVHNTYVRGNWAITSWYKDGFTVTDITRPNNVVKVGGYDTYPGSGGGSQGCWGVYHRFTSGNVIASNISVNGKGELWIVTPTYLRACYLEGKVTNANTGAPLINATVRILGTNPVVQENTASTGIYRMGQEKEGTFTVQVSLNDYDTYMTTVELQRGHVTNLDVALVPSGMKGYESENNSPEPKKENTEQAATMVAQAKAELVIVNGSRAQNAHYTLPDNGQKGTLDLMNSAGQLLRTWSLSEASGEIELDTAMASGIYFAILKQADKAVLVKKFVR